MQKIMPKFALLLLVLTQLASFAPEFTVAAEGHLPAALQFYEKMHMEKMILAELSNVKLLVETSDADGGNVEPYRRSLRTKLPWYPPAPAKNPDIGQDDGSPPSPPPNSD